MTADQQTHLICLRPMLREDVARLADIHVKAFAHFSNSRLGTSYARHVLHWFLSDPHAIAIVAEIRNLPIGYVVGAPLDYRKRFNRAMFLPAIIGYLTHPRAWFDWRLFKTAMHRVRSTLQPISTPPTLDLPKPAYSLVSIAVSPDFQGLGIGQRLVEAFENHARTLGAVALRLSTRPGHAPAIALYERCGWIPHNRDDILYFVKLLVGDLTSIGS